jgi:hypothetical protein
MRMQHGVAQTFSCQEKLHLPGSTSEQPLVPSIPMLAWLPASANESVVRGTSANHAMRPALYRQLAKLHHHTRGGGAPRSRTLCDGCLPIDETRFTVARVGGPLAHYFDKSRLRPMSSGQTTSCLCSSTIKPRLRSSFRHVKRMTG